MDPDDSFDLIMNWQVGFLVESDSLAITTKQTVVVISASHQFLAEFKSDGTRLNIVHFTSGPLCSLTNPITGICLTAQHCLITYVNPYSTSADAPIRFCLIENSKVAEEPTLKSMNLSSPAYIVAGNGSVYVADFDIATGSSRVVVFDLSLRQTGVLAVAPYDKQLIPYKLYLDDSSSCLYVMCNRWMQGKVVGCRVIAVSI